MTTVYMLESKSKWQMMSFLLKSDDHLIVIDGGNTCDADYLCDYIISLGAVVDAWFITHPHGDHCNGLSELLRTRADEVVIKGVYYNFPSDEFLDGDDSSRRVRDSEMAQLMRRMVSEHNIPVTTVHQFDKFIIGEMTVTVLREPNEAITVNRANNASVVYRVDANEKTMLFLGDLCRDGGEDLLKVTPHELLKADIVQMSHHGQDGVPREVYDLVDPDYCFWCTPAWLWDNDNGLGYDTHNWKTIITRGWMSEIGVKWHYVLKDGTQKASFDDLDPTVHMVKND